MKYPKSGSLNLNISFVKAEPKITQDFDMVNVYLFLIELQNHNLKQYRIISV